MILVVLVLAVTIALSGGFIVGVACGVVLERERANRQPPSPHEVLAAVYEFPTPRAILAELRGPLPGRRSIPEARGDWWGV